MYEKDGYLHIKQYLDDVDMIASVGLGMRLHAEQYSDWKGIACASKHSIILDTFYRSDVMTSLAKKFLGNDCYYFNDQMVYKLANEKSFVFEEHYDNQYGTNADNKIHTVNFCVILDDFEISLDVKGSDGWVSLYPKKGDIIAIRGDTYHRSAANTSDKPRGLYACVYTEAPMNMDGFYNEKI